MNVDYNEEVLGCRVTGEEGVGWEVGESDGAVNEGNKYTITRITRMVLTDSGVV